MENGPANINDVFFQGHYKEVWRKLIPPGLSEAECSFIEEEAGLQKKDRVLDLMCGYGRHALELARRGYQVTALDNLQDYLTEIQVTATTENLPVEIHAAGVLEAPLHRSYKAIVCMGNSFAFFNKANTQLLLKKIAAHLTDDGTLIINSYMIAEIAVRHFKQREWMQVEDYKYLLDYTFHLRPNRIESEHTIITPAGAVEVIKGVDYIYSINELEDMFLQAGLRLLDIYATPRKRKFKMGDNVSYLVAGKIR